MNIRWKAWQICVVVGLVCAGILVTIAVLKFRVIPGNRELVSMLPLDGAGVLYIDVKTLREEGILDLLAGNRVTEESDYRSFVELTGFDYRADLDVVAGAVRGKESFYAVVGRFDWAKLKEYALRKGGSCLNGVCDVPSSIQGRWISFRPMKSNVLALASTSWKQSASSVYSRKAPPFPEIPTQPVWVSFPAAALGGDSGPAGTRLFAKALAGARDVTFALDRNQAGGFEATMVATCRDAVQATELYNQLTGVTGVFRTYLERLKKQPNPEDLSGVLTVGAFERRESRVYGRWPVPQAFLATLAGGDL